jgi:hypothetical protein
VGCHSLTSSGLFLNKDAMTSYGGYPRIMQRGLWSWIRKDSPWHEMSGDVKVRRLLRPFSLPTVGLSLDWSVGACFSMSAQS